MRLQFLEERFKHQFRLHQTGHFGCTRCRRKRGAGERRNFRVPGKYLIYLTKPTPSISGANAWRIFFTCEEYGHLSFVGYTKPVDFTVGHENYEIDTRTFAEENEDEERELMEYLKFGERTGKSFIKS